MGAGCTRQPVLTSPIRGLSHGVSEAGGHSPGRVSGVTPWGLSVVAGFTWSGCGTGTLEQYYALQLPCPSAALGGASCATDTVTLAGIIQPAPLGATSVDIPRGLPTWTVFMVG